MYHYKNFDGEYLNNLDQMVIEHFNEYGYNSESNQKKEIEPQRKYDRSGPKCLGTRIKNDKK